MSDENTIEQVELIDPSKKTSAIDDAPTPEEGAQAKAAVCWYNGRQYGQGAVICSDGTKLYCSSSGATRLTTTTSTMPSATLRTCRHA